MIFFPLAQIVFYFPKFLRNKRYTGWLVKYVAPYFFNNFLYRSWSNNSSNGYGGYCNSCNCQSNWIQQRRQCKPKLSLYVYKSAGEISHIATQIFLKPFHHRLPGQPSKVLAVPKRELFKMIFSIFEFNPLINNESHLGISLFFKFSKYAIIELNSE